MTDFRDRAGLTICARQKTGVDPAEPGRWQTAGQGGGAVPPPVHPLAAFVYPDGSMEELQPPGAAAFLGATPPLVDYALAHAESATFQVRFFWLRSPGRWVRVDLDRAPPDSHGQAVLVTVTPMELPAGLTPRELDVLTLMACGLGDQEIAGRLHPAAGPCPRRSSTSSASSARPAGRVRRGWRRTAGTFACRCPGAAPCPTASRSGTFMPGRRRARHRRPPAASAGRRRPAGPPRVGPAAAADRLGLPAARSRPPRRAGDGQRLGPGGGGSERLRRDRAGGWRVEQVVVDMDIFSTRDVARAFQQLIEAEVDVIISSYLFAGLDPGERSPPRTSSSTSRHLPGGAGRDRPRRQPGRPQRGLPGVPDRALR